MTEHGIFKRRGVRQIAVLLAFAVSIVLAGTTWGSHPAAAAQIAGATSATRANSSSGGTAPTTDQVADAQASSATTSGSVYGCPLGYVCMYTDAGFNSSPPVPEHKYFHYGCYNLSNEFGYRAIVNNQTGGATVSGYNNYGCTSRAWRYPPAQTYGYRVYITPINSISLNP